MSRLGHVGSGLVRDRLRKIFAGAVAAEALAAKAAAAAGKIPTAKKLAAAEKAKGKAFHANLDLEALFESADASGDVAGGMSAEEIRAADLAASERLAREEAAELDQEERGWQQWERHKPKRGPEIGPSEFVPPKIPEEKREPSRVAEYLPPELRPFLERMPAPRRREREEWILKKIGWEGLKILGLSPAALAAWAEDNAREYAKRFPSKDKEGNLMNQEANHRRGRDEKVQRKRGRRAQSDALLYVEAAIGAVGGPKAPGRPLYVSDYGLLLHRQHRQRTEQILGDLWLVREDDPSVRIPMLEVDRRARAAKAAERRTLIDMMLYRWRMLGWHVCWITVTLPGQYVCHSTNEGRRATEWDPDLGPLEAMGAIQEDFHRVMCILREKKIRPSGFWNSQPQQSGTPHRHILIAVPSLHDARAVCDAFRREFGTRKGEEDGPDRGCTASVIGDDDPKYRTRKGKNKKDETPATVARYSARYSTRQETGGKDGDGKTAGGDEQERFEDWKRRRRARGHTWLGLDSQRSPVELWRTLWANAQRSDYLPDDARMALAMRHMKLVKQFTDAAVTAREAAKAFPEGDDDHAAEMDVAREAADEAAREAWHASIALGMWPDSDLDPVELEWLRGETAEGGVADPLPPMPLRAPRETVYGETHNAFVGAVGTVERFRLTGRETVELLLPIAEDLGMTVEPPESGKLRARHVKKALKAAGFGFSIRPDESIAVFDCSGEILLKTEHSWLIVDTETAKAMVKESAVETAQKEQEQAKEAKIRSAAMEARLASIEMKSTLRESGEKRRERRNQLSVSPSYPRLGPDGPPHEDEGPPG